MRAFLAQGARARTKGRRYPARDMFGKYWFGWWATSGGLRGQPWHVSRPRVWPLICRHWWLLLECMCDIKYSKVNDYWPGFDWRLKRGVIILLSPFPSCPVALNPSLFPCAFCWSFPLTPRNPRVITVTQIVFWRQNYQTRESVFEKTPPRALRTTMLLLKGFSVIRVAADWVAHSLQDGIYLRLMPRTVSP